MRGRKKRTLILGILCCLLVFMGVGFAVARTTLNIGGTSTAINTWDVRIANILLKSSSDGVTTNGDLNKVLDDGTTAEINVDFIKPGDYITFEFSVENNGSIDASIGTLDVVLSSDNETDSELFDISNTFPENSKLEAGDSVIFEVTIKYKDEADKIPEGSVIFDVKFNYSQGDGNGGGNTPGGGTESEKDWDFEVDENGTITAYNYDLGTDVVVPATNYEGKAIKTITQDSFIPRGNIDLYEDETGLYAIVKEDNTTIVDTVNNRTAAEVVVDKTLYLLLYEECQDDSSCINSYKEFVYLCADKSNCYKYTDETKTIVPISESAELMVSIPVNPDPNVIPEESIEIEEDFLDIETLDLSNATNLISIEESAFYYKGITSLKLGNGLITIGDSAFVGNQISGELVIPDSVTTIGVNAFADNYINSIMLGKNIKTIGSGTFSSNQISGELIIPNSVTTIGTMAFYSNQINSLMLGDNVTEIGDSAFSSNQISNLSLGDSVTKIGDRAFEENQISGELIIPNCVTTIEDSAFYLNQISGELVIPDSITKISTSAFSNNRINSLVIPTTVTEIGDFAFLNNQISQLEMSHQVKIGTWAFNDNKLPDSQAYIYENNKNTDKIIGYGGARRENLTIPYGVIMIEDSAFYSNQISGELTMSDSVTTIGFSAFSGQKITKVNFGKGLKKIGSNAFKDNQISGELEIPNSVTTIGSNAFKDNEISNLIMTHELEIGEEAFNNNQLADEQAFIYKDNKSGGEIVSYGGAKRQNIIIPNSATSVGNLAFNDLDIEGKLIISNNITSIGRLAFAYNLISSLEMTHELEIGEEAFNNNQLSDEQAYIYENNDKNTGKIIGYGGAKRENLSIPLNATSIGESAFSFLNIKGKLVIPDNITEIGRSAFSYNQINSLVLGNGLINIGSDAFGSQYIWEENLEHTLSSILIKRTEADFLENVIGASDYWYDATLNPTITYDPS